LLIFIKQLHQDENLQSLELIFNSVFISLRKTILIILVVSLILIVIAYFIILHANYKEEFSVINDTDGTVTENNIETGKVDKLVVLFSTQYRTWENCAENHISLMKHIQASNNQLL
jgi:hypothetical protein